MIRNLLATTAIATLIATGAFAQSSTPTPPASGEEPAQPVQQNSQTGGAAATPDSGAAAPQDDDAATDATAQDSTTAPAADTAQDSTTAPAADTAQDSTTAPADATAQDSTTAPAADTAQDSTTTPPVADTAQDSTTTTTGADTQMAGDMPDVQGQLASNLIGARVFNGANDDAENIGEVNDVVIGNDGKAEFAIIGVGGFLGIGEKDVAIEYTMLKWAERDGDMWLVIETSKEQLEAQPAFDRTAYDPEAMAAMEQQAASDTTITAPAGSTMTQTDTTAAAPATTATAPATTGEAMESTDTAMAEQPAEGAGDDTVAADSAEVEADKQATETAQAPAAGSTTTTTDTAQAPADGAAATDATQTAAIDRSTLSEVNIADLSAEEFVGTTVYGAGEENVGEIGDVVLSQDGQVDAVIIDVGGFLGMGEKEVAVGMDNLAFMADEDGNRYLYTEFTEEQLNAQPAYDEAGYAENRDTMRMSIDN